MHTHCGWEGNRGHDEDEVAADAGARRGGVCTDSVLAKRLRTAGNVILANCNYY